MRPIRNWGVERSAHKDEVNGRRVWQLTNHEAPSAHFYFTRPSWLEGWPRPFFVSDRGNVANLYTFDEDWSVLQLTDLPRVEGGKYWTSYNGKTSFRAQQFGANFMAAEADPNGGGIYFSSGFGEQHLMRYDFASGKTEKLFDHAAGCITSDGRYSLFQSFDDDYEKKLRHTKLYRIDLATGARDFLYEDDGDFAHMLCSPVAPELVIWISYHRRKGMTINPRTGELGTWVDFAEEPKHRVYYHYSFLPKSSLLLCAHRGDIDCTVAGTGGKQIVWEIRSADGDVADQLKAWNGEAIAHATVSHDHRRVVGDTCRHDHFVEDDPAKKKNNIYLFDRELRTSSVVCAADSSFSARDEKGRQVYSEYLHPRPVFSPDDKKVIFDSDFTSGITQVYMVGL